MRLTVDIPDSQMRRLEEAARRLNVAPEVLASAALEDVVGAPDKDFVRVADRVVIKNSDLYRRLA